MFRYRMVTNLSESMRLQQTFRSAGCQAGMSGNSLIVIINDNNHFANLLISSLANSIKMSRIV